jgi:hypothetical protein
MRLRDSQIAGREHLRLPLLALSEVPLGTIDVRSAGKSGRHVLALSLTGFSQRLRRRQ